MPFKVFLLISIYYSEKKVKAANVIFATAQTGGEKAALFDGECDRIRHMDKREFVRFISTMRAQGVRAIVCRAHFAVGRRRGGNAKESGACAGGPLDFLNGVPAGGGA
jgi:predicted peroxiredoxin